MVFTMERIAIRYALAEMARDKRFVESLQWWSEEIFFAQEENLIGSLCCRRNVYHQNLDMTDEMKYLPGAWIWKKTFHYCIIRRSEATWGLLFMSRYCSRKHVGTV